MPICQSRCLLSLPPEVPREWRVKFRDEAWEDLDRLTPAERQGVSDDLATWVPGGPPSDRVKTYSTFSVLEHDVLGCVVVYQILEATDSNLSMAEVFRVRRRRSVERESN